MAPSARVACGSVVDVSVKLADDMGRTVHPTSDVRVSLAFRKPPTTGVVASPDDTACGHEAEGDRSGVGECMHDGMAVITGASSFDDPLLSLDDSWDGDDDDDADESTHIGLYSSRYSRCQHTSTCILRACSTQNRPYACAHSLAPPLLCDPWQSKVFTISKLSRSDGQYSAKHVARRSAQYTTKFLLDIRICAALPP